MPGHLPKKVKKARMQQMLALAEELGQAYHQQFVGQTVNVLWESVAGADAQGLRWQGYTDNYMRVMAHGSQTLMNQITAVAIQEASPDGVSGQLIVSSNPPPHSAPAPTAQPAAPPPASPA